MPPLNATHPNSPWRFCTAPMMEWSDQHCRYLWRLISQHTRLYTEMVTTPALLRGDRSRFLAFNPEEHPVALQLGGSNVSELVECAKLAEQAGFDEVNLNCGCPSDRVQEHQIGACLMAHPALVAECLNNMQQAVSIPVTVKHRTGIDHQDSEEQLHAFVAQLAQAGCQVFIVHARKAWLNGLSPKENRVIPPLQYDRVHALKQAFPHVTIVINGGINTVAQCQQQLEYVDGVMMGREAYHSPYVLADVDTDLFDNNKNIVNRDTILEPYIDYCWRQFKQGTRLHHMSRHILGLFAGQHGGRLFRRHLSENACRADATPDVLVQARKAMQSGN